MEKLTHEFKPSALSEKVFQSLLADETSVNGTVLLIASFPAYLTHYGSNSWKAFNIMDYLDAISKLDIGTETENLRTLVKEHSVQCMAAMEMLEKHGYITYMEGHSRIRITPKLMKYYEEFLALVEV